MRFRQMDGLRAAAALAVVMIHVSAGGATGTLSMLCNQLSRFAVPMFLVLTGFGHAGALAEGKFEPQGWTAVRRRLSRVLPPYFLWSAAYLVLEALCGTPHKHPPARMSICTTYSSLCSSSCWRISFVSRCRDIRGG